MSRPPGSAAFRAFLLLGVGCALACSCRDKSKGRSGAQQSDEKAPRLVRRAPSTPAPASVDRAPIGSGPETVHPEWIPLALADGVTALDPPVRALDVWPVPDRPLGVVAGRSGAGLTIELVDLERASVRWIDTTCPEPVVHTTSDRIVCGGARGIDGIEVDSGKAVWNSPLAFRTAHGDYLFGFVSADPTRGGVVDVRSGKVVAKVRAPEGESLERVVRLCADDSGFDLFAMTGTELRRLRVSRDGDRAAPALVSWKRRLPSQPTKMDLCDRVILVELAGEGGVGMALLPIFAQTGTDAGAVLPVQAWWPTSEGDEVATATEAGVELRARDLTDARLVTDAQVSGRLVAARGKRRLLRSIDNTLLLLEGDGAMVWLDAPVDRKGAVLSSKRLLVGPRRSTPQTEADYATLWELPPSSAGGAALRGSPPNPVRTEAPDTPKPQPLPKPTPPSATVELGDAGSHGVTHATVAGERLYAIFLNRAPGPLSSAGIAAFDLGERTWLWHREDACVAGGEAVGLAVADGVVVCGVRRHYPRSGVLSAVSAETGKLLWQANLPTVDAVAGAGSAVVAWSGDRAVVLRAVTGEAIYDLEADNGYAVRAAPVAARDPESEPVATRVVSLEPGGLLVARDPAARGAPVWAMRVRGYARALSAAGDHVAVWLASGELSLVGVRDGETATLAHRALWWYVPGGGGLVFDDSHLLGGSGRIFGYATDGSARLHASFALDGPLELAELRSAADDAPLVLVSHRGEARALVVEPKSGAVSSVHLLPPNWVHGSVFGAVAGGAPISGVLLQKPLAVQIF